MNVALMKMDPDVAERKLREYRRALHRRADATYEAAAKGYEQLAQGRSLIQLSDVIRRGGFDHNGRPRLAIARSDRKEVYVYREREWYGHRLIFDSRVNWKPWRRDNYDGTLVRRIPLARDDSHEVPDGRTLVPIVPADIRNQGVGTLSERFTLFEVDEWKAPRQQPSASRDPYLLQHLAGDLYAVIAEWNLTDLERAVMLDA